MQVVWGMQVKYSEMKAREKREMRSCVLGKDTF